jgi:hypothetical protein
MGQLQINHLVNRPVITVVNAKGKSPTTLLVRVPLGSHGYGWKLYESPLIPP